MIPAEVLSLVTASLGDELVEDAKSAFERRREFTKKKVETRTYLPGLDGAMILFLIRTKELVEQGELSEDEAQAIDIIFGVVLLAKDEAIYTEEQLAEQLRDLYQQLGDAHFPLTNELNDILLFLKRS
jgi:hypothetical protein